MMRKMDESYILAKVRAILDLVRIDLVFGAGIFVVAGEIFGLRGLPPLNQALLGFLTGFFISGSANISNDYFDWDVDRVNQPGRPLPSGRISVAQLWTLFFLFTAAGLATATLLGSLVLALAAAVWVIALLYNMKLKEMGLFGNLTVAFCVAMTVIIGGATIGMINGIVLTFAALAFLFDLGEEIAADAMDVIGDELRSSKSIAKRKNKTYALRLSGVIFIIFIMLSFLPFLMGWLGYVYLLLIVVTDLCISYFSSRLLLSDTIEEGRIQIRRLYLTWGMFVAIFIFANLI
jgi:geranylgeranylglycerol-phosphate geranylgeranyltransferase